MTEKLLSTNSDKLKLIHKAVHTLFKLKLARQPRQAIRV